MRILLVALVVLASCAAPDPVGRKCDLGEVPKPDVTVISSQSLDCASRLCVQESGAPDALCSAACETDEDCVGDPATPCATAFTCAVVTEVGPFAGQPMCVCR